MNSELPYFRLICLIWPYFSAFVSSEPISIWICEMTLHFSPQKSGSQTGNFCCPPRKPCSHFLLSFFPEKVYCFLCSLLTLLKTTLQFGLELFTSRPGPAACWPLVKVKIISSVLHKNECNFGSDFFFPILPLFFFSFNSKYTEEIVLPGPDFFFLEVILPLGSICVFLILIPQPVLLLFLTAQEPYSTASMVVREKKINPVPCWDELETVEGEMNQPGEISIRIPSSVTFLRWQFANIFAKE